MATAINSIIAGDDNDDDCEETAIPEDHQLVLAAAWLNLKECSIMAGSLVENLPLQESPIESSNAMSFANIQRCGDLLLKILSLCRHKGAILAANTAWGMF